jgi:hypothetical protein
VFKRATTLEATAAGLSERTGRRVTAITWGAISAVTARVKHGKFTSFTVVTDDAGVTIDWLAGTGSSHPRRNPSSFTTTGEELAALVVARSGKTLIMKPDE